MKKKDRQLLVDTAEWEGGLLEVLEHFEWKEIKDEEFHKLRENYLRAIKDIKTYLKMDE